MNNLIIGLGQDATLLALKLLKMNTSFKILVRRSTNSSKMIDKYNELRPHVIYSQEVDFGALLSIHQEYEIDYIYNFAANSFVQDSHLNFSTYINGNYRIVAEILKFLKTDPTIGLFHPLSSEILDPNDQSRFRPRNAYGVSKLAEYFSCNVFAEHTKSPITTCVMFNHESNLRTNHFFTKKILSGILEGKNNTLEIYNTQSQRDWGYAPEFIDIILESQKHNYIGLTYLGTGNTYSVEDFIDLAFTVSGVDYEKTMIADKWVWACSNITIKEISRNIKDSERILAADRLLVERTMGTAPTIYGQKLVQKLIHDFV